MKTLIKFISLFTLSMATCWAQPTPVQVQEATAAQVTAGTAGFPFYISPRRLASATIPPGGNASGELSGTYPSPTISRSITPTMTGLWTFGSGSQINAPFGVNALPSSDNSDIGSDVNEPMFLTRTTNNGSATVSLATHVSYHTTPVDNTQVISAGLFDAVNNAGAGVSGGAGHFPALIGRSTDTSAGAMNMVGVEGKVHRLGTSDVGSGVWSIMDYDMSSASGRTPVAYNAWAEFYSGGNTSNTINAGNFIAYNVTTPACANASSSQTGWYSIFAGDWFQIKTGGAISSYSQGANSAKDINIQHNGTDGYVVTNSGNIQLQPAGGFVLTTAGVGLVPISSGGALGIASNAWSATLQTSTLTTNIITAGSGTGVTVNQTALQTRTTYKVTTTFAAFSAGAKTADLTIATIPAKMRLVSIICDVTTTFGGGGESAATFTAGHAAGGATLLASFDCHTATITKGLADADLGSDINRANAIQGGYLGSWSATTPVSARLTTTTNNTSSLTQGSATWYLVCEQMP